MTQMLVSGMFLSSKAPTDLSCIVGTDASGKNKWAGECAACGKWCGAVQERLERNDIRCKAGFYRDWRRYMVRILFLANILNSFIILDILNQFLVLTSSYYFLSNCSGSVLYLTQFLTLLGVFVRRRLIYKKLYYTTKRRHQK